MIFYSSKGMKAYFLLESHLYVWIEVNAVMASITINKTGDNSITLPWGIGMSMLCLILVSELICIGTTFNNQMAIIVANVNNPIIIDINRFLIFLNMDSLIAKKLRKINGWNICFAEFFDLGAL